MQTSSLLIRSLLATAIQKLAISSIRPVRLRQRGFTLPEMMVSVSLMALLVLPLYQMLVPALDARAKVETDARLEILRVAALSAYKAELTTIDAQAGANLTLATGAMTPVVANASGACPSTSTTFAPLARYLQMSSTDAYRDGWGQGLCVLMTSRQSTTQSGITYFFHNYAFVSPGRDGAIDAGTALSATSFTLGGDDKGVFIDGRSFVASQVDIALAQVQRAAAAVQSYFLARYLANTDRDTAINYFARRNKAGAISGEFDTQGALVNTGGSAISMLTQGIDVALGLTQLDLTTPWGTTLLLDNSSDATRHPENATTTLRTPPFTAQVSTTLPSGATIVRTAVGTY